MFHFRLIKSLAIMYVVAIQFLTAITINVIIDNIVKKHDKSIEYNKSNITYKSFLKYSLITVIIVCIFAVISYFARLAIRNVSSPFDGLGGLKHHKLRELTSVSSLTAFLFLTSSYLNNRVAILKEMFEKLMV